MIVDKKRCLIPSATKGKISTPVMCMHVLVYQMIWFVFIMQVIMVCVCVCACLYMYYSHTLLLMPLVLVPYLIILCCC